MKVALGGKPHSGPWGGGNRFLAALSSALEASGHRVVYDLHDPDIDVILLTDPRPRAPHVCFAAGAIIRYLAVRNPNALVVHRVNECDERKGEAFINDRLVRANYAADATVFVGSWLSELPIWRRHLRAPWFTVRNGADARIFNADGFVPWGGQGPLRLVTHHWGYHPLKGFDVYAQIDRMLDEPEWRAKLEFTFVGNLPRGFRFERARYVPPLDGTALADELRMHHAYVTASVNEPGGNHQNEGALCGLPLLYRNSGCMPEYCDGFGVPFEGPNDFERAFEVLVEQYRALSAKMASYPHTADKMAAEWIALFEKLCSQRLEIVAQRRLWRSPWTVLANQLPI